MESLCDSGLLRRILLAMASCLEMLADHSRAEATLREALKALRDVDQLQPSAKAEAATDIVQRLTKIKCSGGSGGSAGSGQKVM